MGSSSTTPAEWEAGRTGADCWDNPDQLEAALERTEWLASFFGRRDESQGLHAPSYGTSPEIASAHELYCRLYDRLEALAPARLAFSNSGGGWEELIDDLEDSAEPE